MPPPQQLPGSAKVATNDDDSDEDSDDDGEPVNLIAEAARKAKSGGMQQKIFGKTIVFTETKREADELVSGGVFKSLTAQVGRAFGRFFDA